MKLNELSLAGGALDKLIMPSAALPAEIGRLGISGTSLVVGDGDEFKRVAFINAQNFPFSAFTFGSPVTGRIGPTLAELRTMPQYAGAAWTAQAANFSVAAGIQIFTVPATGWYELTAIGGAYYNTPAAIIRAKVFMTKDQKLRMLIGQSTDNLTAGGSGSYRTGQSGCGGTFVILDSTVLIVAGGAGGTHMRTEVVSQLGSGADSSGGAGFTSGLAEAGGGGGLNGNGVPSAAAGGFSYSNGGQGGANVNNTNKFYGGFGGGGAAVGDTSARSALAGGGGYRGGAGIIYDNTTGARAGNPGTSYAAQTLVDVTQAATEVFTTFVHNGSLTVTRL